MINIDVFVHVLFCIPRASRSWVLNEVQTEGAASHLRIQSSVINLLASIPRGRGDIYFLLREKLTRFDWCIILTLHVEDLTRNGGFANSFPGTNLPQRQWYQLPRVVLGGRLPHVVKSAIREHEGILRLGLAAGKFANRWLEIMGT